MHAKRLRQKNWATGILKLKSDFLLFLPLASLARWLLFTAGSLLFWDLPNSVLPLAFIRLLFSPFILLLRCALNLLYSCLSILRNWLELLLNLSYGFYLSSTAMFLWINNILRCYEISLFDSNFTNLCRYMKSSILDMS